MIFWYAKCCDTIPWYSNEYPTKYWYTAQQYLHIHNTLNTSRDICISVCTGLHLENLLVRGGGGRGEWGGLELGNTLVRGGKCTNICTCKSAFIHNNWPHHLYNYIHDMYMYTLYWYLLCVCVYLSLCSVLMVVQTTIVIIHNHSDCMNIFIYYYLYIYLLQVTVQWFTKLFSSNGVLQTTILRKGHGPKYCVFCC